MSSIFISYRRNDAGGHAGRLYDRLRERFYTDDIFYDQSGIESGEDFPLAIQNALNSAQVILVVVGPDWLNTENYQRLNDEKDFVRREVLTALSRKEQESETAPYIITVLVGGATPPTVAALPGPVQLLAFIHSHNIQGNFDDYNRQVEALCDLIGRYSRTWVLKHNLWLKNCLADNPASYANFNQDLSVFNPLSHYIQRKTANEALNSWWSEWKEKRKPFVLLGEEGDGKSWALASWIGSRLCLSESQIPVVFISATKIGSSDLIAEMGKALESSTSTVAQPDWCKRLQFILKETSAAGPKIVLVLDGLNERPSFDWRSAFDQIRISPFADSVAVLGSCRTGYWRDHLEREYGAAVCLWQLPPFDEQELDEALIRHNLSRNAFSDRILQLVAKPRYFDMAVRLKDRMAAAGDDVTVDRLIYEDWRDKEERKRGFSTQISHADFHAIISGIAANYGTRIGTTDLARELALFGDQASIRSELISSGILIPKSAGKFEVAPRPLVLGFGLLLANTIEESGKTEREEVDEIIARLLGPHSDSDRLVQICAMAMFHSLLTEDYPDAGRIALFRSWIAGRNLDKADFERIYAYFPLRPNIYFQIAEELWSSKRNNHEVQDHFMVAFLQQRYFDRVREEMIAAFERWFGFIHPCGYRGYFEREPEKHDELMAAVKSRLGQEVELGPLDLLGHRFEVIADINLLRLGQVAASVITHFNRLPFVRSLTTGLIAASVMDGTHTEFSWVLRTADTETKDQLLREARHLISIGSPEGFRAGYKVLSSLCNEEALEFRETIPKEFHWKNPWLELLGEGKICDSMMFTWSEKNYLECVEQTRLASIAIASKLKSICCNPSNQLPIELALKLDNALSVIDFSSVRSNIGHTREDHDLREIEPALCAYRPEQYLMLAKSLTELLPLRDGQSKMFVAFELSRHLPVLGAEDRKIILNEWRAILPKNDREDGFCETILFYLSTFDLQPIEQLELALERSPKECYFTEHPPRVHRVGLTELAEIEDALARTDIDEDHPPIGLLWYLSHALSALNASLRMRILRWFGQSEDDGTRGYCLQIICRTVDDLAAKHIISSGWRFDFEKHGAFENEWGSILLCELGIELPFGELVGRIMPEHYGYAVCRRGKQPEDIEAYTQLLHTVWSCIAYPGAGLEQLLRHVKIKVRETTNCPLEHWTVDADDEQSAKLVHYTWGGQAGNVFRERIKRAFDPKAAEDAWQMVHRQVAELYDSERQRGNHWIGTSFRFGNLKEVLRQNNQIWRQWLDPVFSGRTEGQRQLAFCQGFYEKLCEALLEFEPEIGVRLFNIIYTNNFSRITDANTGVRLLNYSLFKAPESPPVIALKRTICESCTTDNDLFEVALVAQECGQVEWLEGLIAELLESAHDYDKARGLQLLGFMDGESAGARIQEWISCHGRSWLMDVARNALKNNKRNEWAKVWFGRFEQMESRLEAWAFFRLLLQCVDRRYWVWERSMDGPSWKVDALTSNYGAIRNATKENEKKLKDKFLCHEVKSDQLWPWMKRYLNYCLGE